VTVIAGITPVSQGGDSIGGTITVDSREAGLAKPGNGCARKAILRASTAAMAKITGDHSRSGLPETLWPGLQRIMTTNS